MITRAKKEDLDEIESIEIECFGKEAWTRSMLESDFNQRSLYLLAVLDDGNVAGYASILLLEGEGELLRVAVKKRYRKKGIGTELIRGVVQECVDRAFEKIYLEVKSNNESALEIYKKENFFEVARRKSYYPDGEDAVIMSRLL